MLPGLFDPESAQAALPLARPVRLLGLDVDGVLTDGTVWYGAGGEVVKGFNILDGLGLRLLAAAGIRAAVISARRSEALERRLGDLGIEHQHLGVKDKRTAWIRLISELGLTMEQTAFIGDDLLDLPVLTRCGLALSVANGHPLVRQHAHWVTRRTGGRGAVREVCELILAAQGRLEGQLRDYLDG